LLDELQVAGAFVLALGATLLTVPLAIRVAVSTGFLDRPGGYKVHGRPTPYLGGAAVVAAFLPVAFLFGDGSSDFGVILLGAAGLAVIGTIDDRVGLGPLTRVLATVTAAVGLFVAGLGWQAFEAGLFNLLLTIFWVVGLVNAFNLMDNQDGAAGIVAMVCAAGAGAFAAVEGDVALAALALALSGACAGFLRFNLARPARVFLGDGGSMPVGLVIAAVVMSTSPHAGLGPAAVLAAAPLVGLPILDTTLVVISRLRRGVNVLSGGRDHLTHRLLDLFGSVRSVALAMGLGQAALCLMGLALFEAADDTVWSVAGLYLVFGAAAIFALDWPFAPEDRSTTPAEQESGP
jgi:UDP-GlcNAc:undecaprenyl-phosphate/decaprenyl-phosphate GlcNAc-1-phosphate transferase